MSEFRKLTTTRSVWGLLAGVVVLTGLGAWGTLLGPNTVAGAALATLPLFIAAVVAVTVMSVVLGVRAYTDEARHGSIVPTLLATPERRRVVAAKLVVVAGTAAVFAVVASAVAAGFGMIWFAAHGIALSAGVGALALVVGKIVLVAMAWSMIGLGVGLAVGHQVAAIVGSLIYLLVVEDLVGALLPGVAKFLPSNAADSAVGMWASDANLLAPVAGALLLAAWITAFVLAGTTRLQHRDIS
jgi:ABC-2 type transport system permease protein